MLRIILCGLYLFSLVFITYPLRFSHDSLTHLSTTMSDHASTGSPHDRSSTGSHQVDGKPDNTRELDVHDPFQEEEQKKSSPYVILPWRIGLFLFTSTILQNFSYQETYIVNMSGWTPKQSSAFSSLVYNMIYLGPIFGLAVDLIRVFRERYRPVVIGALLINAILSFCMYFSPSIYRDSEYGACIVVMWLMEITVMFVYIPLNAVVIWHGNSATESPEETSARIGGLMAQAMVWRTAGTLVETIVQQYAVIKYRSYALIAAIGSLLLIAQMLVLMKRSYFVDRREASLTQSTPYRFYKSLVEVSKNSVSHSRHASGTTFMFVLSFIFIYFALPEPLYNTVWQFNGMFYGKYNAKTAAVLSQVGALLGAATYAVWMFFEYSKERAGRVSFRMSPMFIMFVGCAAWAFGIFFHLIGQMATGNASTSWKAFIPIQSLVVGYTLRLAFMPTLSLAAMHAPRNYETAAFELYSVCTTGGGVVSGALTTYFMGSYGLDVTVSSGYWKFLLLALFIQFVPMIIAFALPKYRDAETQDEQEKINFAEDPADV